MQCSKRFSVVFFSIFLAASERAMALPGQPAAEVAAWINANPTLRADKKGDLLVHRTRTPAQQFTFQATVLPPGKAETLPDRQTIRSETIALIDLANGVSANRLQEALRVIYGIDIYQDFQQSQVIYTYPTPEISDRAAQQNRPLLALQQGELRVGDRFAYWLEVTKNQDGKTHSGRITVFLKDYAPKVAAELRAAANSN